MSVIGLLATCLHFSENFIINMYITKDKYKRLECIQHSLPYLRVHCSGKLHANLTDADIYDWFSNTACNKNVNLRYLKQKIPDAKMIAFLVKEAANGRLSYEFQQQGMLRVKHMIARAMEFEGDVPRERSVYFLLESCKVHLRSISALVANTFNKTLFTNVPTKKNRSGFTSHRINMVDIPSDLLTTVVQHLPRNISWHCVLRAAHSRIII